MKWTQGKVFKVILKTRHVIPFLKALSAEAVRNDDRGGIDERKPSWYTRDQNEDRERIVDLVKIEEKLMIPSS
jgi:hypothetical protein